MIEFFLRTDLLNMTVFI